MATQRQGDVLDTGARRLLAAYVVLLAFMLLAPSAAAPSLLVTAASGLAADAGLPATLATPERMELLLNVAAFAPVPLLGTRIWPSFGWRDWTALGFVASLAVEVVQAVAMEGRSATHADVVANTCGALLGAVVAAAVRPGARD